jgi:hypothetical protein
VKANDITPGGRYIIRVAAPAPGAPRLHTTRTVTVIAKPDARTITVEWTEPHCTNLADYQTPGAPHGVAWAMLQGWLRYEPRPVRGTIRVADVLGPAAAPTSTTDLGLAGDPVVGGTAASVEDPASVGVS